jgi:SAM-dependent methyltransferase
MSINHAIKSYQNEGCTFVLFDGENIPAEDFSIDAVISFQVIEHVPDVQAYLKEIKRVLKKGGFFMCSTPNRLYRLRPGEKPWNPFHLREYAPLDLKTELQTVFQNTELHGVHGTKKAHQIEVERAQANWTLKSKIARNTPGLLKMAIKQLSGLFNTPQPPTYLKEKQLSEFNSSDYFVKKTDIENSLDLLGICWKS